LTVDKVAAIMKAYFFDPPCRFNSRILAHLPFTGSATRQVPQFFNMT